MVSAVVVVLISAVICTVRRIPDVCELCHVGGLFPVQLFDELGIDRSAISVHSALVDFQGVCNQPFMARHKVGEVSQGLRCVSVCSNVNVWEVNPAGKADEQVAREGLSCMEVWMKELGLTMNLHELGATEEMLHGIANGTIIMEGGYKVLNHDEVLEILKNSL